MKRRFTTLLLATLSLLALSLSIGLVYGQVGGGYDLSWSSVDGGGATFSTGGSYELGGTIGQLDAGVLTGGTYSLEGGFWGGAEGASPTPTATATPSSTSTATITATPSPTSTGVPPTATMTQVPGGNAFAHLAPSSPITVAVGSHFTLDLKINSGSHQVVGQQSYLTFPYQMLQNVQLTPTTCISSSTVTGDFTTFETQLQNQVCNGPGNCTFGGNTVPPGSMAFASGALNNPPAPANSDFRVARISFCANTVGTATVRWQFSPPDPQNRHSKITDEAGLEVSNRTLYQDFTIHVVDAQLTGHVTWQGRPPQPHARQQLPITLTLRLQSGGPEHTYPNMTTDASGFFTPTLGSLPAGIYNWWVKGPQYLANSGSLNWTGGGTTQVEMGLMRVGDANNDNVVDISDFSILRATFGRSCGDAGFDPRADFNGDCTVDVSDFSLLRSNFGSGGAPPIGPAAGAGGTPSASPVAGSALGKAYVELRPGKGAPPNGGKAKVGERFVLELWVNPNGQTQLVGQQSYLAFSHQTLQTARSIDPTTMVFDAVLQNEVCNGPDACSFRGIKTPPGTIAFASGALNNPPTGSATPFKVGEIEVKAMTAGEAGVEWQLSPDAPPNRQSGVVDAKGRRVHDVQRFTGYSINVVARDADK